jgi:TRAP-type uncharacterized transport system fused permease subunit
MLMVVPGIDITAFEIVKIVITSTIGIVSMASGLAGYLLRRVRWFERLILVAAGLLMIYPDLATDIVGLVILAALCLWQHYLNKKDPAVAPA